MRKIYHLSHQNYKALKAKSLAIRNRAPPVTICHRSVTQLSR